MRIESILVRVQPGEARDLPALADEYLAVGELVSLTRLNGSTVELLLAVPQNAEARDEEGE